MFRGETNRGSSLNTPLPEMIDTYGLKSADNVTLLAVGQADHTGTGCMCGLYVTVREIIHTALEEGQQVTCLTWKLHWIK